MSTPITLESIHALLSGFITKQTEFNTTVDANFAKQEVFNAKQEAFNSKQEAFNSKQEGFNKRIEDKIDDFKAEEKANHNLSHRMIMQAFEAISDIRSELDTDNTQPWLKK